MSKIRDGVTIKMHPETRDKLRGAKRGGESYDDLINRLLEVEQAFIKVVPDLLFNDLIPDKIETWSDNPELLKRYIEV